MQKYSLKLRVKAINHLSTGWAHLILEQADGSAMPQMQPGQFLEVGVDKAKVLLNRPISIFNRTDNSLELLVAPIGTATKVLSEYTAGDELTVIGPLGSGFRTEFAAGARVLLIGGGVGVAPLFYQARTLAAAGCHVDVIYGMRTQPDGELIARFDPFAEVHVCTDDGSAGFHGLVTEHPAFGGSYDYVQICGPKPMMRACYNLCRELGCAGEVSLENMMACGLGACLCCVEKTVKGNLCVCKEGPVFNFDLLAW